MLPVAIARSSSDGCDVVMLRTSGIMDNAMFSYHGANGPDSSTTLHLEVRQVAVAVGHQTTTVFGWAQQNAALGTKSATYDSLVLNIAFTFIRLLVSG